MPLVTKIEVVSCEEVGASIIPKTRLVVLSRGACTPRTSRSMRAAPVVGNHLATGSGSISHTTTAALS